MSAARAGEEWAARVLFTALHPPLLRYLRWQEPVAAEMLARETWLALAEDIGGFEGGESALRTVILSMGRGRLADFRARRPRRRGASADPGAHAEGTAVDGGHPGRPEAPDGDVRSVQDVIAELVTGLPPDQAEVVVLRVVGRLSVDEVATVIGRSPLAVRTVQQQAMKRLARRPDHKAGAPRGS